MFPCRTFQEVAPTDKGVTTKIFVQDIRAKISILVISTDPSETIHIRGGQVVLEECY